MQNSEDADKNPQDRSYSCKKDVKRFNFWVHVMAPIGIIGNLIMLWFLIFTKGCQ